jgi:hypothetical protein
MGSSIPEDPRDDEPESHAERFFSAIRLWHLVEFQLDLCLMGVVGKHETRVPPPPWPATLERKLSFLQEACSALPTLAAAKGRADTIKALFTREKGLRNDIVHGGPIDYEDDGTVHFVVIRRRKNSLPEYSLRTVTPKDWDRLFAVSTQLAAHLLVLGFIVEPAPDGALDLPENRLREWEMKSAASFPGSKRLRDLLSKIVARRASN